MVAQFSNCNGNVPNVYIDLSDSPDAVQNEGIIIPPGGLGECCGANTNTNWTIFEVLLNPGAEGVIFGLTGAAGSASIKLADCDSDIYGLGGPICLSGEGPHLFAFYRPGSTNYGVQVTSIPAPSAPGDVVTTEGCSIELETLGLNPASITWKSVSPGNTNDYNHYLNNPAGTNQGIQGVTYTNEPAITITPPPGHPTEITYEVCGTAQGECSTAIFCDEVTVTIVPEVTSVPSEIVAICNGSVHGAELNVEVSGGGAPYTYNWTGPNGFNETNVHNSNADQVTVLEPGEYQVEVTDATDCNFTSKIITVLEYHVDIVASTIDDYSICSEPLPTINLTGTVSETDTGSWSGGTGAFEDINDLTTVYTPSSADINNGSVTITLTPENTFGCPFETDEVTIAFTDFTSTINPTIKQISCFSETDGEIELDITAGSPSHDISSIEWVFDNTPHSTDQNLTTLSTGEYIATITDENGCIEEIGPLLITQPLILDAETTSTDVTCFGANDGTITITNPTGGYGNYEYSIDNGTTWATTSDYTNLEPNTYVVIIRDSDYPSCTVTLETIEITEPAILDAEVTSTNVTCFGANDGTITISNPTGGYGNYEYSIDNGTTWATTSDYTNLEPDTYVVIIRDADFTACTIAIATIEITEPAILDAEVTSTDVTCFGANDGTITITNPTGGYGNFEYSIDNGTNWSTTTDYTNLAPNTYVVIIRDSDYPSCTVILETIVITQPAILDALVTSTNVTCFEANDGTITISNPTGGYGNFEFSIDNGTTWATSTEYTNLAPDTYVAIIRDLDYPTCTIVLTTIEITQPTPLEIDNEISQFPGGWNVSCPESNDGYLTISVTGGTPNYTYLWSNQESSSSITNLVAGTYEVTIEDANGCAINAVYELIPPTPIEATPTISEFNGGWNVSCPAANDGFVNVVISGGTPDYTYNWSNGEITQNLTEITAGDYTLTITDVNECQHLLEVELIEPLPIIDTALVSSYIGGWNISCNGYNDGEIELIASGGTLPLTYSWNTGQATNIISNLYTGQYEYTITDANGCVSSNTVNLIEPDVITIDHEISIFNGGWNISCNGFSDGFINLDINGGTPEYSFDWSNGETSQNIENLVTGNYSVTVTDLNMCENTFSIELIEPTILESELTTSVFSGGWNISCFDFSDGVINTTIQGGTPEYTFLWNNGESTQNINNLPAGDYNVQITDINGCVLIDSINLIEPTNIISETFVTSNYNGNHISCNGASDGSVSIEVTGGSPSYNYTWQNDEGNIISENTYLSNIEAGTYTVTLTDQNGCKHQDQIEVTEPDPLITDFNAITDYFGLPVSCVGLEDGTIVVTYENGTPDYTINWVNRPENFNNDTLYNIGTGEYTVKITDANGCNISSDILLEGHPIPDFNEPYNYNFCLNDEIEIDCITPNYYDYTWDFSNGKQFEGCRPENFYADWLGCINATVEATSQFGCKSSKKLNNFICVHPLPEARFATNTEQEAFGNPEV